MARKNRKWFPGAIYHIMARGNYRQNIFKDDEDFKVFLVLMQDAKTKYGFKLHAGVGILVKNVVVPIMRLLNIAERFQDQS